MTKKDMMGYIAEINKWLYNLGTRQQAEVLNRQVELLIRMGYKKHYVTKNFKYQHILDYLDCLISASYDILGECI